MKFLFCALLLASASLSHASSIPSFHAEGDDVPGWSKIFESVNIHESGAETASIRVVPADQSIDVLALAAHHIVVVEGFGPAAQKLGITASAKTVPVRHIVDEHGANQIIWAESVTIPIAEALPLDMQVFARENWTQAPVLAGKRTAKGAVLWIASSPGITGIERYPYLLQALVDLGLQVPAQSSTLWAFFDSSYRIRADVDYLAERWRKAGIGVLHVAAWHNMEPDTTQDEYLNKLIAACHRHGILVYAWVELPHVSEKFWADHPEWRERTALDQDAQLDWRKLMNLQNPACRHAVAEVLSQMLKRFDWDGVNVAELYFESLEGASNPARFTPMNADVRNEFKLVSGFDPILLFDPASSYSAAKNGAALRKFLDYRAVVASRMQSDWVKEISEVRSSKPYLDIVLTHIDDRFDPAIRDELGADVARTLPLMKAQRSTLLVEDPANLWNLGADRYGKLAGKYHDLTPDLQSVAVDINVVDRYQDVYPTKKQTGIELFQLVHEAARSFGHVAIYFENSIEKQDLPLLPAAGTAAQLQGTDGGISVNASDSTRVAWNGPVAVDGRAWPIQSEQFVLTPGGHHVLTPATDRTPVTLSDFNGAIDSAWVQNGAVQLAYTTTTRAIATLGSPVASIEVDNKPFGNPNGHPLTGSILLPAGQHVLTLRPQALTAKN